jgi:hypothetical protein
MRFDSIVVTECAVLTWKAAPIVASKTCIVVDDDDEVGDGVSDLMELIVVTAVAAEEVVVANQWDYCSSYRHLPYHRSNYFQETADGLHSLQFVRYLHLDVLLLHLVSIVSVGMMIDSYGCLILSFLSLHLPLALKSETLRVLTFLFLDYPCHHQ